MSIPTFLEAAQRRGAQCVQIGDNFPVQHLSQNALSDIRAQADELGLEIEIGMRGLVFDEVLRHIEIATSLGSSILRIVIDSETCHPSFDTVIKTIEGGLPTLSRQGIKLAIENHDRFAVDQYVSIVRNTDPHWVGICLDSVNSMGSGAGFYEVAHQLIPITINAHIKDYQIKRKEHQMGFDVTGTVAGQGMLPIPWLLDELKGTGICQSAILELWPEPEANLQSTIEKEARWAQESMLYLKHILG